MRTTLALCFLSGCFLGCGGSDESFQLAPVSGVVKLNGKPLANATVTFVPQGTTKTPGPTSSGKTDDQGKFTLKTAKGENAAVVGTNRVMITTLDEAGSTESDEIDYSKKEDLPARYNSDSELTFEVPEAGSEAANFDLKSK